MNELVVFDEVKGTLAEYKAENEILVFDYADEQGSKDARSHIAKLRKVKTKISDVHKEAKAEALEVCRNLDAVKRDLIGEVEGMINVHKDPLDAIDAEKQAVIDAEKARLAEEERKRLEELEARERAVKEAEEKAEREEREKKIAEEAAAKARTETEQKAKAEAYAKEQAEKKRTENKKHREKIEGEIHFALTELAFDANDVDRFLTALKENQIPHVSINY